MPAYVAVPQNSENGIAFTLFFRRNRKKLQKQLESVVSCSFDGTEANDIVVSQFTLEQTSGSVSSPKYTDIWLNFYAIPAFNRGAFIVNQLNLICPDTMLESPSPYLF